MSDTSYDVAILGAGPNGLTAAAYLAKAGAKVLVLEHRFERGGTFASDDYSTPYTYNLAQMSVPLGSQLPPYVDLELDKHAVRFTEPAVAFSVVIDGVTYSVGRGGTGLGSRIESLVGKAISSIPNLLYRSPDSYSDTFEKLATVSPEATEFADLTPAALSALGEGPAAGIVLRYAAGLAGFTAPDDPIGVIGAYAVAQQFYPAFVLGGTKNLANGLYRVAANAGARAYVSATVTSVIKSDNGFTVSLADRRQFAAKSVISTLDPQSNVEILSSELVSTQYRDAAARWKLDDTGAFTAHFGVKGEPAVEMDPSRNAACHIIGFRSAVDVSEHFARAERGEPPTSGHPGHVTFTTVHDPLQASPGPYGPLHTLRFETYAPLQYATDRWERQRPVWRKQIWELLADASAPLRDATLLFQFCDSPADIAKRFPTTRSGSIRHGSLAIEQTFQNRPEPSTAGTRSSIQGLYFAGGSVHPGIPGSLGSGYVVAGVVADDLNLTRWWPEPSFVRTTDTVHA
jgi:phytoene dehydrogenase-like protein